RPEGGAVAGPRTHRRWLAPAVVTVAVAAAMTPRAAADEPLRLGSLTANEARPVRLAADEVFSWTESGEQVILLKGKVLLEQGVVSARAARAGVWIDLDRRRATGVYHIQVIADGEVAIENGSQREKGPAAI